MNNTTNNTPDTLLQLLKMAINHRAEDLLPTDITWPSVLKMAQQQGVRGLTYEALELLKQDDKAQSDFPDRMTLIQWYAQTSFIETAYARHLSMANEVTALWKEHGLRTIVFKGLAHSRYYPIPSHREFGDFDCYLLDSSGRCAYKKGNDIARQHSMSVDEGWYKHSHIRYKQLTIENHQFFTSARRGGTDKALHQYIIQVIGDGKGLKNLNGTDVYVLPAEAEGLFMLYHSLTHFLIEGINLRHFVDWACWIKHHQETLDWNNFYTLCKRFNLDGFVDVLNTIAAQRLGITFHNNAICTNNPYAERTIESALYDHSAIYNRGKGRWYQRLHVIGNAFKYSWKYRHVAHYSVLGYVWQFVYGFVTRNEED